MKDARLELRVDPELKRRVEARAKELGQKTTTFVERALEKALEPASDVAALTTPPRGGTSPPAPPRASQKVIPVLPTTNGHLPTCQCPVCKPK